jgi:ABC-type uncharacterized transport system ATPase subunit
MNMLSWIYSPDSGSIFINGQAFRFHAKESYRMGIV